MKSSAIADTFTVERPESRRGRPASQAAGSAQAARREACGAAQARSRPRSAPFRSAATACRNRAGGRAGERQCGVRRHRLAFIVVRARRARGGRRRGGLLPSPWRRSVSPRAWPERPPESRRSGWRRFASSHNGPVYWAGRIPARKLELTTTGSGTFVRYLPLSASGGDSARAITIATYPLRNAFATAVSRSKSAADASKRSSRRRSRRLEPDAPDQRLPGVPGCPAARRGLRAGRGAGPHAGSLRAHSPGSLAGCTDSVNPCKGPPTLRLACVGVVPRKLLIGGLLALAFAAPAAAPDDADAGRHLRARRPVHAARARVAIHVVRGPRPTGLYALRPVLSNETIQGARARHLDAEAPLVGRDDGRRQRRLLRGVGPSQRRADARRRRRQPAVRRPLERRRHAGRRPRRPPGRVLRHLARARPAPHAERPEPVPGPNGVSLFTPSYGPATPPASGVDRRWSSPRSRRRRRTPTCPGPVVQVAGAGGTPIPRDGAVLVARGTAAAAARRGGARRHVRDAAADLPAGVDGDHRRGRRRPGARPRAAARSSARRRPSRRASSRRATRAPASASSPDGRILHGRHRRPPARLQRRDDELRARADAGPARRRDRLRASTAAAPRRSPSTGSC